MQKHDTRATIFIFLATATTTTTILPFYHVQLPLFIVALSTVFGTHAHHLRQPQPLSLVTFKTPLSLSSSPSIPASLPLRRQSCTLYQNALPTPSKDASIGTKSPFVTFEILVFCIWIHHREYLIIVG
ncbi:hypothetical protein TIFTF001_018037 [Ficus carica]|uniref:Uncharacterized protein n=1 Tax=Ficus carica TaxID=3494 RepID=A0AA88DAD8_FICCA|nr:hypothetical protein TIFTF001_018037 [Ficus carica]